MKHKEYVEHEVCGDFHQLLAAFDITLYTTWLQETCWSWAMKLTPCNINVLNTA